ncbi:hypothetical protein T440DRAFT_475646 [Plenodomus tracheiphilus IPT5]|uniref:Uncharacterized protein n=1 Tax=Plenodomus tracheiphilus IPT5 TaxID=1408161 RepID=A0A6A7BGG5_9PLEO|nr:hypothetical protein T440DRAFT_475646 [Plenodomus tracheiphilus IPT5]
MPRFFCPYQWASSFNQPIGTLHTHWYDHPYSSEMRGPRWASSGPPFNLSPCCDFCHAWDTIPHLDDEFQHLQQNVPHCVVEIYNAFEQIHHHYQHGFDRDGPESYYLAREVERLSKYLNELHRAVQRAAVNGSDDSRKEFHPRQSQNTNTRVKAFRAYEHHRDAGMIGHVVYQVTNTRPLPVIDR